MKSLCYRGAIYQRIQEAIDLIRIERFPKEEVSSQSSSVPASVKVLCYRGVFYLRETRSNPNSKPVPLRLAQARSGSIQLEGRDGRRGRMPREQMGYLYKLYFLGWRNGSLKHSSQLQHWLLSLFFYYRRGFAEASEWKQNQLH